MTALAALIRARRERLRLSQEDLARECGCSLRSVQKVESGAVRRPYRLPELAARLGITDDEIRAALAEVEAKQ